MEGIQNSRKFSFRYPCTLKFFVKPVFLIKKCCTCHMIAITKIILFRYLLLKSILCRWYWLAMDPFQAWEPGYPLLYTSHLIKQEILKRQQLIFFTGSIFSILLLHIQCCWPHTVHYFAQSKMCDCLVPGRLEQMERHDEAVEWNSIHCQTQINSHQLMQQ